MGAYDRRVPVVLSCQYCRGQGFRDESVLVRLGGPATTRVERVPCHACRADAGTLPTRKREA